MVEYGINRAKYHGGDLVGVSIQRVVQNASSIIKESAVIVIKKYINFYWNSLTNSMILENIYIELGTLFGSLFSISRIPSGKVTI